MALYIYIRVNDFLFLLLRARVCVRQIAAFFFLPTKISTFLHFFFSFFFFFSPSHFTSFSRSLYKLCVFFLHVLFSFSIPLFLFFPLCGGVARKRGGFVFSFSRLDENEWCAARDIPVDFVDTARIERMSKLSVGLLISNRASFFLFSTPLFQNVPAIYHNFTLLMPLGKWYFLFLIQNMLYYLSGKVYNVT